MKTFATIVITLIALHLITSTICFASDSQTSSFSGLVWDDANCNGVMERTERAIPHVTVTVQTLDGVTVDTIEVDANGYFISSQLPYGDYRIWTEIDGQHSEVEHIAVSEVSGSALVKLAVTPQSESNSPMHAIMLPLIVR